MGKCVSRDIQCKRIRSGYGYKISEACPGDRTCGALRCVYSAYGMCNYVMAPNRLYVQDGAECVDGVCVGSVCQSFN